MRFLPNDEIGVVPTCWLSDDEKTTLWPKRARDKSSWIRTKKLKADDLSKHYVKYQVVVLKYAGEFVIKVVLFCKF